MPLTLDPQKLFGNLSGLLMEILPRYSRAQLQSRLTQEQIQGWLQKSLIEQANYTEEQKKLIKAYTQKTFQEVLAKAIAGGAKGQLFPGAEIIKRGQAYGLDVPGQVPADIGAQVDERSAVGRALFLASTTDKAPSDELMEKGIRFFGWDAMEKLIERFSKGTRERATNILRKYEAMTERQRVPIAGKEAETAAGRLALDVTKGVKEVHPDYKIFHDTKTQPLMNFLKGLKATGGGIDIVSLLTTLQVERFETLMGGALTREKVGQMMARISALDTKARKAPLTEDEMAEIDSYYDIFARKEEEPAAEVLPPAPELGAPAEIPPIIPEVGVAAAEVVTAPPEPPALDPQTQALLQQVINILVTQYNYTTEEATRRAKEKLGIG